MNEAMDISYWQLCSAAVLLFLAGGISFLLKLGLEKKLALAATRTVCQLLLVGLVLDSVFRHGTFAFVCAILAVMIGVASHAAIKRPSRGFEGAWLIAFFSLAVTSLLVIWTVTRVVIQVDPWWTPRYMIPLMGMVLGNSLTGISLGMDHFLEVLSVRRAEVETELALGATAWEAAREPVAESARRAMIPIINSMMVVGLVSLPGMMTGQVLAGSDPMKAVKYQIVVMFMIAAAAAMGAMLLLVFSFRRLFSKDHRLLIGKIYKRGS
ncbi:MAG: iron export ABC transporter permease subunit FetB [Planctomycetes bacterium]|nr:iron export ABC transporter permease subunit FetB [Planctomycetota bacterium]